jgi:hypothetical protein
MGRKLLDISAYWKGYAPRKPNCSPPSRSFSAAETTTPYPVCYKSNTISTLERPIEFTIAPVWPYSGKEYIKTDGNWTTFLETF